MDMNFILPSRAQRRNKAKELWVRWAKDYNGGKGLTVAQIAKKYKNPVTGKPYTRGAVYDAFRKLANLT